MPFKSQAQARYLFANQPRLAQEFAAHTPSIKKLPEKLMKAGSKLTVKLRPK